MSWVLWVVPVVALFLGLPIYVCFLAASIATLVFVANVPTSIIPQVMFGSVDSFTLLAVPFFLFAGELMGRGGIADRLVRWCMALFGGLRGGLGLVTVASCVVFGTISGSSAATVASIGRMMYPRLRENGYGEKFSLGLITATGAIDILIPPSIMMILYCVSAEQSVAKLFIAGFIPGLLLAAMEGAFVVWYAKRSGIPVTGRTEIRTIARSTVDATWSFLVPVVILGGIYSGIFTPTEAAGVAAMVGILVGRFVYRDTSWRDIWGIAINSGLLTAQIMIIVSGSMLYAWLLTIFGVPQGITGFIDGLRLPQWGILLCINAFLIVVGGLIDPTSAILVLTPLLVPIVKAAGVDLIHFGIILTTNLAMGMFTPPFAINMFVTQAMFGVPTSKIVPGLIPFIIIHTLVLIPITFIPWLSLVLTRLL
jgi:C4-dicarboxylate transporter DctM subunit